MEYSFECNGHSNIRAKHRTTLEFTKDTEVSVEGDCIVGVRADFELSKIMEFIKTSRNKKIAIIIQTISKNRRIQDKIIAEINPDFSSDKELVIRKTDFISERTFAIKSNKAAFELNRDLAEFLKEEKNKIKVIIKANINSQN